MCQQERKEGHIRKIEKQHLSWNGEMYVMRLSMWRVIDILRTRIRGSLPFADRCSLHWHSTWTVPEGWTVIDVVRSRAFRRGRLPQVQWWEFWTLVIHMGTPSSMLTRDEHGYLVKIEWFDRWELKWALALVRFNGEIFLFKVIIKFYDFTLNRFKFWMKMTWMRDKMLAGKVIM